MKRELRGQEPFGRKQRQNLDCRDSELIAELGERGVINGNRHICKRFSSSPRGNKLFPKLFWVGGQPLSFTKNVTYQKTRKENKSTLNLPEKYSPTGECVTPSHTSFPQHFRWCGGVNMHKCTALQAMPCLKRGGPPSGLSLHQIQNAKQN